MPEYEIAVLKVLEDGTWRDRNHLKAKQTLADGHEYSDYTKLMRSLEEKELVERRPAERGPCQYEYRIAKAGLGEPAAGTDTCRDGGPGRA